MKRFSAILILFLMGCGSTSTSIIVADKMTSDSKFGQPEIRLEFKINQTKF
jgi:hypothetical protein